MFTLEELVELEYSVQESAWANYENVRDNHPGLLQFVHEPSPRRTREQIRARLVGDAAAMGRFRIKGASYKDFDRRN